MLNGLCFVSDVGLLRSSLPSKYQSFPCISGIFTLNGQCHEMLVVKEHDPVNVEGAKLALVRNAATRNVKYEPCHGEFFLQLSTPRESGFLGHV